MDKITNQRNRYETGLEKLDFAAGQVFIMQQELNDLKPKLIVASAKTEKLMIKIEQDTIIVEKQKEVRRNKGIQLIKIYLTCEWLNVSFPCVDSANAMKQIC